MSFKRIIIASCLMIITMIFLGYVSHVESIPPQKSLSNFPDKIGDWMGKEGRFDDEIYAILGVDDSILYNYAAPGGRQVQLYVGFYQSQREGDLIHSPKNCMPGAGWNIIQTSQEDLSIPDHSPDKIKIIKLVLQRGPQRQLVYYWFQSRGRFIASEYWQKIYLVIDSITKHRTDGSFVRLISPVIDNNDEKTIEILRDFSRILIPILEEYLPS
ncbi:exosortase C-terminal domain/associated protein EpsI [Thermodesulfobacteriota bacterium]